MSAVHKISILHLYLYLCLTIYINIMVSVALINGKKNTCYYDIITLLHCNLLCSSFSSILSCSNFNLSFVAINLWCSNINFAVTYPRFVAIIICNKLVLLNRSLQTDWKLMALKLIFCVHSYGKIKHFSLMFSFLYHYHCHPPTDEGRGCFLVFLLQMIHGNLNSYYIHHDIRRSHIWTGIELRYIAMSKTLWVQQ